MERVLTPLPSGSSRMTLRSACNGTCTHQHQHLASSSDLSPRHRSLVHHHNHQQDHHHHHFTKVVNFEPLSPLTSNAKVTRSTTIKENTVSARLLRSGTSLQDQYVGRLALSPLPHRESIAKTVLTVASTSGNRQHHYSDYSSADELDSDDKPKTDYTYAYSYNSRVSPDEPCPPPNMSRPPLRNSGGSSNSSPTLQHRTSTDSLQHARGSGDLVSNQHGYRATTSEWRSSSTSHIRNGIALSTDSQRELRTPAWYMDRMYGLDSDSEVEEDSAEMLSLVTVSTTTHYSSGFFSACRHLVNRTGFLTPFLYVWKIFWSSVYWAIASVLLLDTRILVSIRQLTVARFGKFLLLLAFLIPLLLAGYYLLNSGANQSLVLLSTMCNVTASYFVHLFHFSWTSSPDVTDVREAWMNVDNFGTVIRHAILQIYGKPEDGSGAVVDNLKLERLIRDIVRQEFSSRLSAEEQKEASENMEYLKLKEQVEANTRLKKELEIVIEERMAVALNKILELNQPASYKQFARLRTWLKSFFVSKMEMEQSVEKVSADVKTSVPEYVNSRLMKAVDAAVAQSIEKYMTQHSAKVEGERVNVDLPGEIDKEATLALIRQQIAIYDADKIGLPDYALESSGGSVISTRCSETYQTRTAQFSVLGFTLWYLTNSPRTVIQPGVSPGKCWAFKGTQGFLVIQLSGLVRVSAFSLEHIAKSISPLGNIDSAPKEFSVWGLEKEQDVGVLLGNYVYEQDGEPLQYFVVKEEERGTFPIVELRIHSNHGNIEYTCLYRFRVHGDLAR